MNARYNEELPRLYHDVEKEVFKRAFCPGTIGPKKKKRDCVGPAVIALKFNESVKNTEV